MGAPPLRVEPGASSPCKAKRRAAPGAPRLGPPCRQPTALSRRSFRCPGGTTALHAPPPHPTRGHSPTPSSSCVKSPLAAAGQSALLGPSRSHHSHHSPAAARLCSEPTRPPHARPPPPSIPSSAPPAPGPARACSAGSNAGLRGKEPCGFVVSVGWGRPLVLGELKVPGVSHAGSWGQGGEEGSV